MGRRGFLAAAPLCLAGCGAASVWAPDDVVARAVYVHDGPPDITLYTMKNTSTGNGAHTGLMINASQRVIFDPAGTFGHDTVPERNDVHFGITPRIAEFYEAYHARSTYFIVIQRVGVTREVAEQAFRLALAAGPVPKASCTRATAGILRELPGMGAIRMSFFPDNLMDQFALLPGVATRERREDGDPDDKEIARRAFDLEIAAERAAAEAL